MDSSELIQEPCNILLNDSQVNIGYTSGGVSFTYTHEVIEDIPDQSYSVSSVIPYNHTATISIPYAEYDFDKIKSICPYIDVSLNKMSMPTYYKFSDFTKLTLLFDSYLFEFPYAYPILQLERAYNKEDTRIINIEFQIITKDNFFNISKHL